MQDTQNVWEKKPVLIWNNSLTLPRLANKVLNSSRDENDKPIYTFNDEYMRWFVRKSIKGVRRSALKKKYRSIISDEAFNNISKELKITGNIICVRFEINIVRMKISLEN